MSSGKDLGGGLDDILLLANAAEEIDLEAGDDACAGADIGTDDDVAAVGRPSAGGGVHRAAGAVRVDGERGTASGRGAGVAEPQVEHGGVDVKLDEGFLALELDDLVGAGQRVDRGAENVVSCIAIEVAVGLGQG